MDASYCQARNCKDGRDQPFLISRAHVLASKLSFVCLHKRVFTQTQPFFFVDDAQTKHITNRKIISLSYQKYQVISLTSLRRQMNLDDIFKSTGEGTETKIEHMCPFMKGLPPPKQNTPHFRNSDKVTGNMQGIERRSKNRSPHTLKQSAFPPNFAF